MSQRVSPKELRNTSAETSEISRTPEFQRSAATQSSAAATNRAGGRRPGPVRPPLKLDPFSIGRIAQTARHDVWMGSHIEESLATAWGTMRKNEIKQLESMPPSLYLEHHDNCQKTFLRCRFNRG